MQKPDADLNALSKEELIALVMTARAEVTKCKAELKQQADGRAADKKAHENAASMLRTQLEGARDNAAQARTEARAEKEAHRKSLIALERTMVERDITQSNLDALAVKHRAAMHEVSNWRTGATVAGGVTAFGLLLSALGDD